MANYPQELAQDAVCQSHTGHMAGLWFLPARPLTLDTNEWMNEWMYQVGLTSHFIVSLPYDHVTDGDFLKFLKLRTVAPLYLMHYFLFLFIRAETADHLFCALLVSEFFRVILETPLCLPLLPTSLRLLDCFGCQPFVQFVDIFRKPITSRKQILRYSVPFSYQVICVFFPEFRAFVLVLYVHFSTTLFLFSLFSVFLCVFVAFSFVSCLLPFVNLCLSVCTLQCLYVIDHLSLDSQR